MNLDEMIIAVYCTIDDEMKQLLPQLPKSRVRQSGPAPLLSDSEVLTIEVMGLFLGHAHDKATFDYFRRHHPVLFPALAGVHRTTYTRQSANLWRVKEKVWQALVKALPQHAALHFLESVPLPVCGFARATFCRRFDREDVAGLKAAYGYDHVARQTFYGFRLHLQVSFPGVVRRLVLTPAHVADVAASPDLLQNVQGIVIGDRNYHSPALQQNLKTLAPRARLLTPPKKKTAQEDKSRSAFLSRLRYRIETVIGQWCQRLQLKAVHARDTWHLTNRLLRAVLCHTLCITLAHRNGLQPLQFAKLLD